jgi:hypothetical protein
MEACIAWRFSCTGVIVDMFERMKSIFCFRTKAKKLTFTGFIISGFLFLKFQTKSNNFFSKRNKENRQYKEACQVSKITRQASSSLKVHNN